VRAVERITVCVDHCSVAFTLTPFPEGVRVEVSTSQEGDVFSTPSWPAALERAAEEALAWARYWAQAGDPARAAAYSALSAALSRAAEELLRGDSSSPMRALEKALKDIPDCVSPLISLSQ